MMRALLLLPFLFLLHSCGHHKHSGDGSKVGTDDADTAAAGSIFYKRYSGTIAGKPVVVQLNCYAGSVQGVYYYQAVGQNIALRDWNDMVKDDGIFYLNESVPEDMQNATGDGPSWTLHISGGTAGGQWRSADGLREYPINLVEEYPSGSTMLDAFRLADSAALQAGKAGSPVATVSYTYVLPKDGIGSFLYDALKEQIAPAGSRSPDAESALKDAMAVYFADYRNENKDADLTPGTGLQSFALSYSSDEAIYVRYNDADWLVTEAFSADYTGGAHGNYGSSFANIDLAQKRIWKLADIMADTAGLRPLLNDAAIAYFRLKAGEGMDQRMLVDDVPPTDNVYVGAKGLSFVYNPYEIASYADGQITLYLSYKKLFRLLTPAFRQRMKLSESAGVAMLSILR